MNRSRACLSSLVVALALTAMGCGVAMSDSPPLSVTIPTETPGVFEELVTLMRSRGYVLTASSPETGTFAVAAQRRARPSETVIFTVQCYRDGFAEIVPNGPRVERRGDRIHLPSSVAEEYRDLVVALRESLARTSGGAR